MAVRGLHYCGWAFSSCSKQGLHLVAVPGLLTAVVSPVAEQQEALELSDCSSCGSRAADRGLSSCDARA